MILWKVEYKNNDEIDWRRSQDPITSTVSVKGIAPFKVYSTTLTSLKPVTGFNIVF
jgi:hypothetical protein